MWDDSQTTSQVARLMRAGQRLSRALREAADAELNPDTRIVLDAARAAVERETATCRDLPHERAAEVANSLEARLVAFATRPRRRDR